MERQKKNHHAHGAKVANEISNGFVTGTTNNKERLLIEQHDQSSIALVV